MKSRVLLSWSSGKDSGRALEALHQTPAVEVVGLLTSVNEAAERVAMHGVHEALLLAQARAVDPGAEKGEFHGFAVDGPVFGRAIDVESGEIVEREAFVLADPVPR